MSAGRTSELVSRLGTKFLARNLSLVTAESCTGGLLAAAIVSDPGASPILERGFVVYSPDAKCDLLGLARGEVERHRGVSKALACAMARAALSRSKADVSVAVTGFAGPREDDEEVGLVHVAASSGQTTLHRAFHWGDCGRDAVCSRAISEALHMVLEVASAETATSQVPGRPLSSLLSTIEFPFAARLS